MAIPTFITSNLYLRSSCAHDADSLFQNYCSDELSSRYLTRLPHNNIEQTRSFLSKWCDAYWKNNHHEFAWVIADKITNEAIGVFIVSINNNEAQIHFGISRSHQKKGRVTEAGRVIIKWLMSHAKLDYIWSVCDLENIGSRRVLEKLGFTQKALLENYLCLPSFANEKRDCYQYEIRC